MIMWIKPESRMKVGNGVNFPIFFIPGMRRSFGGANGRESP